MPSDDTPAVDVARLEELLSRSGDVDAAFELIGTLETWAFALLAELRRLREERDEALMIAEGPSTLRELAACSIANVHARHIAEVQRDEAIASWRVVAEHRAREAEQLEAAEAQRDAMREALRPFADMARDIAENHPGWDHDGFVLDGGWAPLVLHAKDLRRAQQLIQESE